MILYQTEVVELTHISASLTISTIHTIRLVSNHETSKEKRSVLIQRGLVAKPSLPIDQHP